MAIEIVDFPIKNGGSFHSYVKSPEGTGPMENPPLRKSPAVQQPTPARKRADGKMPLHCCWLLRWPRWAQWWGQHWLGLGSKKHPALSSWYCSRPTMVGGPKSTNFNYLVCWLVVSNIIYFPFHIWDVILPIDELHHFSRWSSHHQPVNDA